MILRFVGYFLLLNVTAFAYPPAPGMVVYGMVRDGYGWSLQDQQASLVFSSGEKELKRVVLQNRSGTNATENYRTQLPLDMEGGTDAYRAAILSKTLPFQVHVLVGDKKYLPIEMLVGVQFPHTPSAFIRLDFTLGQDSDSDGLPDEWEYWQLQASGISPGNPKYNLNQLDATGDADQDGISNADEYRSGTFAYIITDKLDAWPIGVGKDGWVELEFETVVDKIYLFEVSKDLKTWEPLSIGLWGDRENRQVSLRAASTGRVRAVVPPPDGKNRYYRVTVN